MSEDPWAEVKEKMRLEHEGKEKKKRRFSLRRKLKTPNVVTEQSEPRWKRRRPITRTLECIIALVLFLFYVRVSITSASSLPIALVLFVPTMWILISFIKLQIEKGGEQ